MRGGALDPPTHDDINSDIYYTVILYSDIYYTVILYSDIIQCYLAVNLYGLGTPLSAIQKAFSSAGSSSPDT